MSCLRRKTNRKKKRTDIDGETVRIWLLLGFIALLIISVIGLFIYAHVEYGGKPITEVPSWALRFFLGGGK